MPRSRRRPTGDAPALGDYEIHHQPHFSPLELIDLDRVAQSANHPWYNRRS
ncbi:MAG: hypothetical protein ACREOD_10295 [Candidatus Dormibacteria bacterium]